MSTSKGEIDVRDSARRWSAEHEEGEGERRRPTEVEILEKRAARGEHA